MRIGLVSWESLHSIAVGGVAPHVTELGAALARGGDEVHVVTRRAPGQGRYDRVDGVHYHRCDYDPRPDFLADVDSMCGAFVARLWEVEDVCGPFDVVHGHDWLTTKAAAWARSGRGRRVVMTIHSTEYGRCGNYFHEGGSRAIRDYEWEAQYVADRVVTVSSALRDEVVRIYSTPLDKLRTIYNGVDPSRFDEPVDAGRVKESCGIGRGEPMVLFVGRMVHQKGPDRLLEAIPAILAQEPRARFVFVGEGDLSGPLEGLVRDRGLGHAVRFLGKRSGRELAALFQASDVFCVPSRNEPFGIVILEAWSARKPVVASPQGGPGEFVWHGVTGIKAAPEPVALAGSIGGLLARPDYGRWIGENGRMAVETAFSWNRIAGQVRELYQSIR